MGDVRGWSVRAGRRAVGEKMRKLDVGVEMEVRLLVGQGGSNRESGDRGGLGKGVSSESRSGGMGIGGEG